jgi:hypothetical protein
LVGNLARRVLSQIIYDQEHKKRVPCKQEASASAWDSNRQIACGPVIAILLADDSLAQPIEHLRRPAQLGAALYVPVEESTAYFEASSPPDCQHRTAGEGYNLISGQPWQVRQRLGTGAATTPQAEHDEIDLAFRSYLQDALHWGTRFHEEFGFRSSLWSCPAQLLDACSREFLQSRPGLRRFFINFLRNMQKKQVTSIFLPEQE